MPERLKVEVVTMRRYTRLNDKTKTKSSYVYVYQHVVVLMFSACFLVGQNIVRSSWWRRQEVTSIFHGRRPQTATRCGLLGHGLAYDPVDIQFPREVRRAAT